MSPLIFYDEIALSVTPRERLAIHRRTLMRASKLAGALNIALFLEESITKLSEGSSAPSLSRHFHLALGLRAPEGVRDPLLRCVQKFIILFLSLFFFLYNFPFSKCNNFRRGAVPQSSRVISIIRTREK